MVFATTRVHSFVSEIPSTVDCHSITAVTTNQHLNSHDPHHHIYHQLQHDTSLTFNYLKCKETLYNTAKTINLILFSILKPKYLSSDFTSCRHDNHSFPHPSSSHDQKRCDEKSKFQRFVIKVLYQTRLGFETIVLSLYYIHSLHKKFSLHRNGGSEYRIWLTSLMLADDYLNDHSYSCKSWSTVSHFPPRDCAIMKQEFLIAIDYKLFISPNAYYEWHHYMSSIMSLLMNKPSPLMSPPVTSFAANPSYDTQPASCSQIYLKPSYHLKEQQVPSGSHDSAPIMRNTPVLRSHHDMGPYATMMTPSASSLIPQCPNSSSNQLLKNEIKHYPHHSISIRPNLTIHPEYHSIPSVSNLNYNCFSSQTNDSSITALSSTTPSCTSFVSHQKHNHHSFSTTPVSISNNRSSCYIQNNLYSQMQIPLR